MSEVLDIARKSQDFQTPLEVARYMVRMVPDLTCTILEPTNDSKRFERIEC
jgi:hypothetical protein